MKKFMIPFLALLISLLICEMALAMIYRWVDENGVAHFSDKPPQGFGTKVKGDAIPTYHHSPPPGSPSEDKTQGPKQSPESSYRGNKAKQNRMPKVDLYTTRKCPYCDLARGFFRSRGIPFREYDIEKDEEAARRKRRLDPRKGVPLAVINGRIIYGFSEKEYARALKGTP